MNWASNSARNSSPVRWSNVDLPTFQAQFPEFANVPSATITAYLNAAALEIDIAQWTGQEFGSNGWCDNCGWSYCFGCTPTTPPAVITGPTGQTKADQGQAYLAAHKMALSPWGQDTRLSAKDGSTTYWTHYWRLLRQVAAGGWVVA